MLTENFIYTTSTAYVKFVNYRFKFFSVAYTVIKHQCCCFFMDSVTLQRGFSMLLW